MRLARYAVDGSEILGEVRGSSVVDLIVDDERGVDALVRHMEGEGLPATARPIESVQLLAPVHSPDKILCIGLNYLDHVRESGMAPPRNPVLFSKYSNALAAPGQAIEFSLATSSQVDFEVELVAIVGKRCRHVSEERALDHVFGYTIGNDVSARDAQFADGQWVRGKTFDTFFPIGPWVVTSDEIPDPQALAIGCWVDGVQYQDSNTAEMIFPVRKLVSYLSQTITLEPGDLIATGTPWGVGFARDPKVFLADGNVVKLEIELIGTMENPVRVTI